MTERPTALLEVAAEVEAFLADFLSTQSDHWAAIDPRLAEPIVELERIVGSGGKRLRAAFCYWSWFGVAGPDADPAPAVRSAAACELLQAFALIHDDIMDDAATRRGIPTVHSAVAVAAQQDGWRGEPRRYGEGVAILVGDLSHVFADQLMTDATPAARHLWDDLRIELNVGQYLDMRASAARQNDIVTAQEVVTFKSALYTIVRPLQLGASLTDSVTPELLDALDRAGRPLGRAFQLRDDLLDVTSDAERLGKPAGSDLIEGKPTELFAAGLTLAGGADREVLAAVGESDRGPDSVAAAVEILHRCGAVEQIENRIDSLVAESVSELERLPYCEAARSALVALAHYVSQREY